MAYIPRQPPANPAEIPNFLGTELNNISRSTVTDIVQLQPQAVEPTKPRDALVAFADGTNWDPGSGRGPYFFDGGSWTPMF